jgi:lysophospholipase L1-like esterase
VPVAVAALAIGWAAERVLHESFRPIAGRHTLTAATPSATLDLAWPEPIVLEYELVVQPAEGRRPAVTVRWNGRDVPTPPSPPFAMSRALVPLPLDATVSGTNVLAVALDDPAAGGFEMRARLMNYRGIAPDPPRAYVVPPRARVARAQATAWPRRMARAALLTLAAGGLVFALTRRRATGGRRALGACVALTVGPVAVAAAEFVGPWHVWLAPETFALVVVAPWLGLGVIEGMRRHRAAVVGWTVVALVSLAGVELALRGVNAIRPTFVFYADDASRFRGQPGAPFFGDTFNSRGFNDRERAAGPPPAGTFRVVALGDSFVVGVVPRRDNYLSRLEAALSARGPAEVINLGVAGTEPRDYLALLVDEAMAYAPDAVLVGFYVGNDFETRAPRWHERSYAAALARAFWRLGREPRQAATVDPGAATYDDAAPGMPLERFLEVEVDRSWIFERGSARVADTVARAADLLGRMQAVARRGGADFVVTVLPAEAQVDSAHQLRVASLLDRPAGALDFTQPNRLLGEALRAAGIEAVDLLPAFEARGRAARLYKPQDSHWNVAGNALAAEALAPVLEALRARRAVR